MAICESPRPADKSRVLSYLGHLSKYEMRQVSVCLQYSFGFIGYKSFRKYLTAPPQEDVLAAAKELLSQQFQNLRVLNSQPPALAKHTKGDLHSIEQISERLRWPERQLVIILPIGEKMGTKRSVLTDQNGLPLSVILDGANRHDIKLLEATLDGIVILRPECTEGHPQNLCLDAGYTGSAELVQQRGYTPHIRPRGEEKKEKEQNPNFRARRWVVEVTHSFFNRFRKLLVRFEKKAANYLALIQFACAIIVWRKCILVHKS